MKPTHFYMVFDGPPDSLGRRSFTVSWVEPDGVFRPEPGPDGAPVGHRRGQCFHTFPADTVATMERRGHKVTEVASEADLPAHLQIKRNTTCNAKR